jgi:SAM-dependent methyltransferase
VSPGSIDKRSASYAGQAVYTPLTLRGYDLLTYRINTPLLWRCSVKDILRHYERHLSARHLDVGVGSGSLLDKCGLPGEAPELDLLDVNPHSLAAAARRLARYSPRVHQGDALAPWPLPAGSVDSISIGYLLHCLPGDLVDKRVVFANAGATLSRDGTLFGTTVLATGVRHTRRSRLALRGLNRRGVFSNAGDSSADLEAALEGTFEQSSIEVRGAVALFWGRRPRVA